MSECLTELSYRTKSSPLYPNSDNFSVFAGNLFESNCDHSLTVTFFYLSAKIHCSTGSLSGYITSN